MRLPMHAWTASELDACYDVLGPAIAAFKAGGRYQLAAMALAYRGELQGEMARRYELGRGTTARQLELVPDPPAWA